MIILRVDNVYTEIVGDLPASICKELERELSFRPKGFQFTTQYNLWIRNQEGKRIRRVWDGWKRQFWKNNKRTYFPTGLFSLVQNFLSDKNIEYRLLDTRDRPDPNIELSASTDYTLRDYQIKTVNIACDNTRGIIQAATGSGKTIIAGGIIEKLNVSPFIFFVTSIDLLIQARDSLSDYLRYNGSRLKVGQIGGGIIDIADINVMTVQTAVRALGKTWDQKTKFDSDDTDDATPIQQHKEELQGLLRSSKGVICDEVQHWRADTCQLIAKDLKSAYYRYGMSATPYRDEGDDLMIQACFGKKICRITASELIRDGWLVRPDIAIVNIEGKKSNYKTWQKIYKDRIVENNYYNNLVANIANGYIEDGRLVLILVQQINHGKTIERLVDGSVFLSGKSTKKRREDNIRKLRNKEIRCICSTTIFDEGIDVRPLDVVVLAGQGKSRTRAMQRVGRITRTSPGKKRATAIDLRVHDKFLLDHSLEREEMYRTEPEYCIKEYTPSGIC